MLLALLFLPEINLRAVLGVPTHVRRSLASVESLLASAYNSLCRIEIKCFKISTRSFIESICCYAEPPFYPTSKNSTFLPCDVQIERFKTRI